MTLLDVQVLISIVPDFTKTTGALYVRLQRAQGRTVTIEQIKELNAEFSGKGAVDATAVWNLVYRTRQVLRRNPDLGQIKMDRNIGYILTKV